MKEGKTLLSMYGVLDRSRVDDEFALMDEFRKHLIAFHRSRPPEVSKRTLDALQSSRETGSRRPRRSEVALHREASQEEIWDVFDKNTTIMMDILDTVLRSS